MRLCAGLSMLASEEARYITGTALTVDGGAIA
jgi:NAD(P)-dependent dehydrogenase (short-subunit alcohol dehydrogenase family)